jgi:hypothetical protein
MFAPVQKDFSAALLDAGRPVPDALTSHGARVPEKRFAVYRNNVVAGLVNALAARFPAVQRIVGEEFFRAMAQVYARAHPPRSRLLMQYGEDFAEFIEGFEPAAELVYLADVAHPHRYLMQEDDLTQCGAVESGPAALQMAGVTQQDIDFAELYDSFTYTVLMQLEDYGFCAKGEGGAFVENGRTGLGGELPVNTHGGLLSQAHADEILHVTEAVKQLRGQADPRQVPNAQLGLISGGAGVLAVHASLILGAA